MLRHEQRIWSFFGQVSSDFCFFHSNTSSTYLSFDSSAIASEFQSWRLDVPVYSKFSRYSSFQPKTPTIIVFILMTANSSFLMWDSLKLFSKTRFRIHTISRSSFPMMFFIFRLTKFSLQLFLYKFISILSWTKCCFAF